MYEALSGLKLLVYEALSGLKLLVYEALSFQASYTSSLRPSLRPHTLVAEGPA